MQAKACDIVCKVTKPFVNAVLKVESAAVRRVGAISGSVAAEVANHDAAGTDAAQASTRRFVAEQRELIPYRAARFFHEARAIGNGEYFKDYDFKRFIIDLRFFTKIVAIYLLAYVYGRDAIYPPVTPDSPFVEALRTKPNPNY